MAAERCDHPLTGYADRVQESNEMFLLALFGVPMPSGQGHPAIRADRVDRPPPASASILDVLDVLDGHDEAALGHVRNEVVRGR